MQKMCRKCLKKKDVSNFCKHPETADKLSNYCRVCKNEKQRIAREKNKNVFTKKYEKTHNGFIMRLYRNMKSRITGVQKKCIHLYGGKDLLSKEEFYEWALSNDDFYRLFSVYEQSGYERSLAPSVDRIKTDKGYIVSNMRFITQGENSSLGSSSPLKKIPIIVFKDGEEIARFNSLSDCYRKLGVPTTNISLALSGRTKQAYGYTFQRQPVST